LQADTKKIAFTEMERKPLPPKPGMGSPGSPLASPLGIPPMSKAISAMTLPPGNSTFNLDNAASGSQRDLSKQRSFTAGSVEELVGVVVEKKKIIPNWKNMKK